MRLVYKYTVEYCDKTFTRKDDMKKYIKSD